MQERQAIEPEVLRQVKQEPTSNNPIQLIKVHLNKNDNRKSYNINNHYETHNTTINNQRGGFFYFLFYVVTLPIRLIIWIFIKLNNKFNLRQTYIIRKTEEKARRKIMDSIKKSYKAHNNLYDEIL